MMRYVFKGIDLGASVVFMALCVKAFCVHFFKDLEGRLQGESFHSSRIRRRLFLRTLSPLGGRQPYRFDQRRIVSVRLRAIDPFRDGPTL
jgi:hypothetical protein